MKSKPWRRLATPLLLIVCHAAVWLPPLARSAGADEPPRVARPHGRRDAANTPNALMRGGSVLPPAPRGAPRAPSAPGPPNEPIHLPTIIPSDSCRRPPPPRRLVRLALKPEAELGDVIAWVSSVTCKQFLLPGTIPANSKKVTLIVPRTITVADAYQLFLSALDLVGLTVEPNGRFLRIIESSKARSSATPVYLPPSAEVETEPLVTRFVRLEHAGADHAAALLAPLESVKGRIVVAPPDGLIITDAAANVDRMLDALPQIDQAPSD